jgi:hypothetical protein
MIFGNNCYLFVPFDLTPSRKRATCFDPAQHRPLRQESNSSRAGNAGLRQGDISSLRIIFFPIVKARLYINTGTSFGAKKQTEKGTKA